MKNFQKFIFLVSLLHITQQLHDDCDLIDKNVFREGKIELVDEANEDTKNTFIRLGRECDSWFIDELGIPCKNLYYKTTGEEDSNDPRQQEGLKEVEQDIKNIYAIVPVNLGYYKAKNQKKAAMFLKRLHLYPQDDFYEDESAFVEGMEAEEVDGESVYPPFVSEETMVRYCFRLREDVAVMPYQKNNYVEHDGHARSPSHRLFHYQYSFIRLEDMYLRQQFPLDSIMKPLDGKPENEFQLFLKFKKATTILNYLFDIIKNISGISAFPEGTCIDFQKEDKSYLPTVQKNLLKWLTELKTIVTKDVNTLNRYTNTYVNKKVEASYSEPEDTKPLLKQVEMSIADKEKFLAKQEERKLLNKQQDRNLVDLDCNAFYKLNPIFIPNISINDFVLTLEKGMYANDPNGDDDEPQKTDFKMEPIENLLQYITLSYHTYPEFINESEKFNTAYDDDEMTRFIKQNNTLMDPARHKYFYVLIQFFQLFQQMFDRYISKEVVFYNCFKNEDFGEPDLYCPDFLKLLVKTLKLQEKTDMMKFLGMEIHYVYQNPKLLMEQVEKFLKKSLEFAEVYTNDQIQINDQKGLIFGNTPIDFESLGNDTAASAYHNKIVKRLIPKITFVDEQEDKKKKYKELIDDICVKFREKECEDIDGSFLTRQVNQNFMFLLKRVYKRLTKADEETLKEPIEQGLKLIETHDIPKSVKEFPEIFDKLKDYLKEKEPSILNQVYEDLWEQPYNDAQDDCMALETDQAIKDCFLNLTLKEKQEMKKRMDDKMKKEQEHAEGGDRERKLI